jgi:hypothetical protein
VYVTKKDAQQQIAQAKHERNTVFGRVQQQ